MIFQKQLYPFLLKITLLIYATLAIATHSIAQITNVTDQTSVPIPSVGHDYIHLLSETVNPANGSVGLNIRIPTPPHGVGPSLLAGITYNSNAALTLNPLSGRSGSIQVQSNTGNGVAGVEIGGWSVLGPYATAMADVRTVKLDPGNSNSTVTCPYFSNFLYYDRTGLPHPLSLAQATGGAGCTQMPNPPSTVSSGNDGVVQATLTSFNSVLVTEQDGTQFSFSIPEGITQNGLQNGAFANLVTDPHGNSAIATFSTNGTTNSLPTAISVNGFANPYTLVWNNPSSSTGTWNAGFTQVQPDGSATCAPSQVVSAYPFGLGSLTLPNNQAYTFQTDPTYGTLGKITYPSGATVSYTWKVNAQANVANWADSLGSNTLGCVFTYGTPVVATRIVSYDGINAALEQDFSYTTTWDVNIPFTWDAKTTTVITKDCTKAATCSAAPSFKTVYHYSSCNCSPGTNDPDYTGGFLPPQIPLESEVQSYDWTGTLLKTVDKQWYSQWALKSLQTTLPNNLIALTTYPGWCAVSIPLEQDDYDWGSGATGVLLKKAIMTNSSGFTGRLGRACLPSSTATYDGSNTPIAQTNYVLDSYGFRNSETTCLLSGSTCSPSSPVTTYTYDPTGLLMTETKPCGNAVCPDIAAGSGTSQVTTYSYTDAPAGNKSGAPSIAYLTKITYPTVNGVTAHNDFGYNYTTGQVATSEDENSKTTTYTYSDPLNRLTQITYPDGGGTTIKYNDSARSVSTSTLATPDPTITNVSLEDGFGRVTQTQLTSDPSGTDTVTTSYDAAGNPQSVSNPFRSSSDPTYGLTTYAYDALGRPRSQTKPGGGLLQWNYSGNQSTFSDEAGHVWTKTTDALGRLTNVVEPNGATTKYTYSASGNLVTVNELGLSGETSRVRNFIYDNLSRLTSATNPETGATQYGYDLNGNVNRKQDSRGVVTSYSYDALNRMLTKTSPGFSGSSSVSAVPGINDTYAYDVANEPNFSGAQNPIGRLVWATTGITDVHYSYDTMGRIIHQEGCLPSWCGAGTNPVTATYDLAGKMTSFTYPDGRHITQNYDSAAHLTAVNYVSYNGQQISGPAYFTYLAAATYLANGAPHSLTFGNGTSQTFTLNNRLQPVEISVQGGSANATQTYLDKQYCYGPTSSTPSCPSLGTGQNNGNIWQITNALNSGSTQGFAYDNLNRLSAFSNGAGTMQQSYAIDSFGNLNQSGTAQSNLQFNASNQISSTGYGYDLAGNVTSYNNGVFTTSYGYDPENELVSLNGTGTTYLYDALGERVRKSAGNTGTEYVYFNGQPITEKNTDGTWSDLIYANGQKIARADTFDNYISISGTMAATGNYAAWYVPFSSYAVANGDTISWRQIQFGSRGGIGILFTDGTTTNWATTDTNGQVLNGDSIQNAWDPRTVRLSQFAGKTISKIWVVADANTAAGSWSTEFADMAIQSVNGTVLPIYTGQTSIGLTYFGSAGATKTTGKVGQINNVSSPGWAPGDVIYYYGDQIGSATLLASVDGWPVSSDTFYPFGQEQAANSNSDHYKFTGKERDAESGLDYFGARYYASSMGRWMSPDWADKPEAVPYSSLDNPQSLNLYGYVLNNPLSKADPDGHAGCPPDCSSGNNVVDFVLGAGNAFASDHLAGALRFNETSAGGQLGQRLGDSAALAAGVGEAVLGTVGNIGGLVLDVTGIGAVVGVPANVASTAVTVEGAATATTATVNLMKSGGNFSSGTKQGAKDAAGGKCQSCDIETTPGQKSQKGVTPPGNEGQTDHIQPRSKGGSNDPSNAQHLCRDCNIKKSDKVPNQ